MAANPVPFPKNRRKKFLRHPFGAAPAARPVTPADGQQRSMIVRALSTTLITPAVLILLIGALLFVLVALLQRKYSPMNLVVVQQFEVSPELANRLSMTGKSASDLFIDDLNQHAVLGSQFHGAEYYAYDAAGAQSIALQRSIKVPVQSSYGIEVKGISIDNLIQVYNRIRYKEWLISGNITSSGDRITARLRLNRNGAASFWQRADSVHSDLSSLIQDVTEAMLGDENPELLGRSYLQQREYQRAAEVFRKWTLASPRDWRPSYYLSLAYDYLGKDREALCLARWSRDISEQEAKLAGSRPAKPATSYSEDSAELAEVTLAVSVMNAIPQTAATSLAEARERLKQLKVAEQHLMNLSSNSPSNSNYLIQLARTLDREAEVQFESLALTDEGFDNEKRAVDLLGEAIEATPENGGLYEQRSIFLQRLVAIAEKQGRGASWIVALKSEEIDRFRRALELMPTNSSPLWGAVYGLLDRGESEDAINLALAIKLLLPDSGRAEVVYVIALERAALHKEAEENLPAALARANQAELDALYYCFRRPGDLRSLNRIAAAGRKRFPQDVTFARS